MRGRSAAGDPDPREHCWREEAEEGPEQAPESDEGGPENTDYESEEPASDSGQESESEIESEAEERFFRTLLKKSDRIPDPRFSELKVKLPKFFRSFSLGKN